LLRSGDIGEGFQSKNLAGAGLLPGLLTLGQIEIGWYSRKQSLELIHDPTGSAPLLLTPNKRVVTIYDTVPYVHTGTSTVLDQLIYHLWLPYAVPYIDKFLTVSVHSKRDISKYLNIPMEKITVIHLAAGEHFRPLAEPVIRSALDRAGLSQPYILYVGSIEPRKNLMRLLEAYAQLRHWSTRWDLVVVGGRNIWKSSPVGETTEKQNLEPFVHFTGYIPDSDLPGIYNGADLFVFPSLYEGFGLPVLEAMACGTPVITSNTSSLPEVAGDAALLVDPYNVEEIAAAMRHVLEDSALANDLRERGLKHAKKFSWEKTARQTISVYEKVLGKRLT
jgi:glycosyltransferase involved in cell wall biosynthesis